VLAKDSNVLIMARISHIWLYQPYRVVLLSSGEITARFLLINRPSDRYVMFLFLFTFWCGVT